MKKRKRRCDPQKQACWLDVMRRWREGGLPVRAFCRAEGVRESAFYFWRRELARRDRQTAADDASADSVKRASPALPQDMQEQDRRPAFLPVQLVGPRLSDADRGVEIVLEQGRTVRVRPGFDRPTLADVLSVLEARPC